MTTFRQNSTSLQEGIVTTAANSVLVSRIKKLTLTIFSVALLYFSVQLLRYHFLLVTFPYPLESFEGAMLVTTDLLLKGENPYALRNMPVAMNVYGINYHLLVFPFAKLWGSTFLVHRAISGFFLLLSCMLLFVILRRHQIDGIYCFSAVLILYASLLYRYTAVAKPDGPGFFLFLLSAYIVYLRRYSSWSLILSIILGVMAFYTKPYFVLSIPYLTAYLFFFVSKKKAIIYGSLGLVLLGVTVLIVNRVFETYFVNTFFNHINVATNELQQLQLQLEFFIMYNAGIFIILLTYTAISILDNRWEFSLRKITFPAMRRELATRLNLVDQEQPLIRVTFPFSLFCLLFSFGLFYFKLGRHVGNLMTYAYHLMTPFLLVYSYSFLNTPLRNDRWVKHRNRYNQWLFIPCVLISLSLLYSSASYLKNSPEWTDVEDWQQLERLTFSYDHILNSQVLVSLLLDQNKPVYDTGQTEFFQYSHYSSNWLEGWLIPNIDVSMQWAAYEKSINLAVRQEEFDAIIVTSREHRSYLAGLEEHYLMVDTIGVCMFHSAQCALLELWEPKTMNPE